MLDYLSAYVTIGLMVTVFHPKSARTLTEFWATPAVGAARVLKPAFLCSIVLVTIALWPLALFSAMRPVTVQDHTQERAHKLLIGFYRQIYRTSGIGPSEAMTDAVIVSINDRVRTAFTEVGNSRGEFLPASTCNRIVLYFLEQYQTGGAQAFESHLTYETEKYRQEGLRPDYNKPLHLF